MLLLSMLTPLRKPAAPAQCGSHWPLLALVQARAAQLLLVAAPPGVYVEHSTLGLQGRAVLATIAVVPCCVGARPLRGLGLL